MKFLNLNLDALLGGDGADDYTVSSQKAIKTYVDSKVSDVLPSKTGQAGKFLMVSDGETSVEWSEAGGSSTSYSRADYVITEESVNPPSYTISGGFSAIEVYLDGTLTKVDETYTISGNVVTFVDTLPVDAEITLIWYKPFDVGTLPVASAETLGAVKIGMGINVTAEGTISANALPAQDSSTANKFLKSTGTTGSEEWAVVDALPDQTGKSGKYLRTDGSSASWEDISSTSTFVTYNEVVSGSAKTEFTMPTTFGAVQVYLNGVLCSVNDSYTVSGQVVTFVDAVPVGEEASFVLYQSDVVSSQVAWENVTGVIDFGDLPTVAKYTLTPSHFCDAGPNGWYPESSDNTLRVVLHPMESLSGTATVKILGKYNDDSLFKDKGLIFSNVEGSTASADLISYDNDGYMTLTMTFDGTYDVKKDIYIVGGDFGGLWHGSIIFNATSDNGNVNGSIPEIEIYS